MDDATTPTSTSTSTGDAPRSRRALLGAALGATAAAAAGALARPAPAAATVTGLSSGQQNIADAPTGLAYDTSGTVLCVASTTGGVVPGGVFKVISTQGTPGILVNATGTSAIGIDIDASGSFAKGMQVYGDVIGIQVGANKDGGSTGLDASAFGSGSKGVSGTAFTGVYGESTETSGVGVHGIASTGTAIKATGKVRFNRSGKASILAGRTYVDVAVSGGLSGAPLCFANLHTYRSGVHVASVTPTSSTGKIRIRLNKVASTSSGTSVSWLVLA